MSRDISRLSDFMQKKAAKFIEKCHAENLDIVIICTSRSDAEQAQCYNAGLSRCKPGQSAHNAKDRLGNACSEAFDMGVIRHGKYIGDGNDPDYQRAGIIGEELGLSWAGRWKGKIKEVAHFQNPSWVKPF